MPTATARRRDLREPTKLNAAHQRMRERDPSRPHSKQEEGDAGGTASAPTSTTDCDENDSEGVSDEVDSAEAARRKFRREVNALPDLTDQLVD